jgi:inosine/xanthosine triphosphate pyrophosphatase family protein
MPRRRIVAPVSFARCFSSTATGGDQGFSFDPVFFYPPLGRTFAELTASEKDGVSHRAVAAAGLLAMVARAGIAEIAG